MGVKCEPFHYCERQARRLGACVAGKCNPPTDGIHDGRNSRHVLKAEGESPDATDRGNCANASPAGGPVGTGQAAAAAPYGVDVPRKITSVAEFCAEAERTGLTAEALAQALSKRPEFADCLPAAGVKVCPECGGEGICYRTQALDDCTACNGTGRVPASGVPVVHGQTFPPSGTDGGA